MAVLPLTIITATGVGLAGAFALLFFLAYAYFKIRRLLLCSGLQSLALCAALLTLYCALLVDCSQPCTLMRSDGVQVPWMRSAVNALIFIVQQWIVGTTVYLDDNAASLALVLATAGGVSYAVADFSSSGDNIDWVWWSIGAVLASIAAPAVNWYLSKDPPNPSKDAATARKLPLIAWLVYVASLVWVLGAPVIQALGPTIGHAFGTTTAPNREVIEILWLCVYFAGVLCFGVLALFGRQDQYKPYGSPYTKVSAD